MSRRTNFRTGAFTLIELLVVIAIIAIVASLLFTALSGSRRKGNQATSLSNLRQWGAALNTSLRDFDGAMPSLGVSGDSMNLEDDNAWFNRLPRYMGEQPLRHKDYIQKPPRAGDRSVWINPAVPKEANNKYVMPPGSFLFCYAMNRYLSTAADPTQPMNRIERPAATVFMTEKGDGNPACDPEEIRAYFGDGDPLADPKNGAHILYCDGHVDLKRREEFDPKLRTGSSDDPSPTDNMNLNRHFTYIPYPGAVAD